MVKVEYALPDVTGLGPHDSYIVNPHSIEVNFPTLESSVGSHKTRPRVACTGPIIAVLVRCWLGDYGTTMPPTDIFVGRG